VPDAPLEPVRLAPTRPRAALLILAVFTFFFSAYMFSASADFFSTGDTTIRIEVAENILGRFSVDLHGWKLEYPHHVKKEYFDPRISVGRDGKVFSTYLLGQPLMIMPFDFIGQQLAIHFRWPYGPTTLWFDRMVGPFTGACEVLVFFLFAVRLGYGRKRALLLTGIFGFATSAWPDAESVLEHTEVTFFLLLAFYAAFRAKQQRAGPGFLLLAGVGIGGAAITRYQDAFLGGLALGLYLLLVGGVAHRWREQIKDAILVGIGLAPFAALDLWYNWYRFGSPLASGHHETVFGYAIWKGAAGLLISPGKGLLWYCPVIFLLIIAGPKFYRRYSPLAISFAALTVSFFLLYGYVTYWHGDPTWGPRYVFSTVPFLTLPLGELLMPSWRRLRTVWMITLAVVGISFVIQLSAIAVSPWRTWYRVIAYEENQGHKWTWIASRYRYFWNIHESPLNFQVHGLYQLAYDSITHSNKYELVPPDEDSILDGLTVDFAVNQWNFWWKSNEFDWWMGQRKIIEGVVMLVALMLASGTYLTAEVTGVFTEVSEEVSDAPAPAEAA
jgi:hypothetical protein